MQGLSGTSNGVRTLWPNRAGSQDIKGIVPERFDFIYGDAHGLSYLLGPPFCGEGMDVATRTLVESSMLSWFGEDKADAVLLQLWNLLCKRKLTLYDCWCGMKQFDLLQTLAKQLFRCASLKAASERNFSTHAFIHSNYATDFSPTELKSSYTWARSRKLL
ncbi:hypothetical protein F443_17446 [Phytophthora nicotianae P1569]|uniref:HAT C-terminal dimerisation domain-containing protein n=1 Tax=Phytophthora nicotianae P1569 TaxID=1317065 RepID=V9EEG3_PHYNI|nr:hypothetical protein F443_17446 [Phytophthora nicotianae P1569]